MEKIAEAGAPYVGVCWCKIKMTLYCIQEVKMRLRNLANNFKIWKKNKQKWKNQKKVQIKNWIEKQIGYHWGVSSEVEPRWEQNTQN